MLRLSRHWVYHQFRRRSVKLLRSCKYGDLFCSKCSCGGCCCTAYGDRSRNFTESSAYRDLTGKTAIVTGCTSGIGLGIAHKLAEKGCDVILNGLGDVKLIEKIQDEIIRNHGVRCQFVDTNLAHVKEITRMCEHVTSEFPGGVDILVNNAGLQHVCNVESFPVEKWDLLIAVMLSAPFHFTRLLLPAMKSKGWGRIVNLASIHGVVASPFKSAYCSAKHGVLGLTKVVALETAGSGVTCNAVCPGFVNTEIFQAQVQSRSEADNVTPEEAKKRILEAVHPSRECVEIEQVADLVHFLCTDSCAQMTGSVITMDGGWTSR